MNHRQLLSVRTAFRPRASDPTEIRRIDPTPYGWTDLTWLLNRERVSLGYYLDHGATSRANPEGVRQDRNVLPGFTGALVISPYSRHGFIDSQTLSCDACLTFIEDDFLGGARLNPAADGRPDSRPVVRERAPGGTPDRAAGAGLALALALPRHPPYRQCHGPGSRR